MRKLFAAALLLIEYTCFAQCPFTVTLQNKGSLCFAKDTLVVSSATKLANIKWYKDGVLDTTVNAQKTVISHNVKGTTVAGGNGFGKAANQIEPLSAFVDGNGKLYVADFAAYRIQQFPKGSTGATNGVTFAGGNGNGNSANNCLALLLYMAMVTAIYMWRTSLIIWCKNFLPVHQALPMELRPLGEMDMEQQVTNLANLTAYL